MNQLQAHPDTGVRTVAGDISEVGMVERESTVTVTTPLYSWSFSAATDEFHIRDSAGRLVARGPSQPAIVTHRGGVRQGVTLGRCVGVQTGGFDGPEPTARRIVVSYADVNGGGSLIVSWRFGRNDFRLEPLRYDHPGHANVGHVQYFAQVHDGVDAPGLAADFYVQPGIAESASMSPVVPANMAMDLSGWLGRGSSTFPLLMSQQWGLPVHYFCGLTIQTDMLIQRGALTRHRSDAFCCGLATLPAGDLLLRHRGGKVGPLLRLNGQLWGTAETGNGPIELGAEFCWTVARDYDEAIRAYYRALVSSSHIRPREHSRVSDEVMSMPQFNTWGAQMADGPDGLLLTQDSLAQIYDDYRGSGLRAELFVVDAKWEGEYGLLRHDQERLPQFEALLDRIRADGHRIGMWAAFLRCDNPESHGLTAENMLCAHDSSPITRELLGDIYYLFDPSQPAVQQVLRRRAQDFIGRYRPALVKFDFGYELPSLDLAAPKDPSWHWERTLARALEVVVGAMREIDPDLVVMYNHLSPLFLDELDVHSIDDVWVNAAEPHLEVNRRIFFSSLMGEIGVPTYGSGGYDWVHADDIWFDSVAAGSLGSLGSFRGDALDTVLTPTQVARFNGLNRLRRRGSQHFAMQTLGSTHLGGSTGARAASWIRRENGEVTVAALRTRAFDGSPVVAEVPDLLRADARTVVASLTDAGLERSNRWGIVPFEAGTLTVNPLSGVRSARIVIHAADGSTSSRPAARSASGVVVDLITHLDDGTPVEWLELELER